MWFGWRSGADGDADAGDLSLKRSRNTGDLDGVVVVALGSDGDASSCGVGFACAGG